MTTKQEITFMRKLNLAFAVLLLASPSLLNAESLMLDVHTFAGKAQADVAKVLGAPSRKEKSKYGPKLSYRDGKVEVVFIDGKADWITVSGMSAVPFDSNSIEALGLKPAVPNFKNEFVIRWEPHTTYKSVLVFPAGKFVDYAYIKVFTD
jgi:hypothetical protein